MRSLLLLTITTLALSACNRVVATANPDCQAFHKLDTQDRLKRYQKIGDALKRVRSPSQAAAALDRVATMATELSSLLGGVQVEDEELRSAAASASDGFYTVSMMASSAAKNIRGRHVSSLKQQLSAIQSSLKKLEVHIDSIKSRCY